MWERVLTTIFLKLLELAVKWFEKQSIKQTESKDRTASGEKRLEALYEAESKAARIKAAVDLANA